MNASHIASALVALDIPNNQTRRIAQRAPGDCLGLTARVEWLEEQVQKLCKYIMAQPWKAV